MTDSSRSEVTPLAQALGRVPSGLFILTARDGQCTTGMLASWVQQAGFEPPMLTVAVKRDRFVADWIARSRRCVLNQIAAGQKSLIRHFARGFAPEAPAFEGVAIVRESDAGPILADALAFLELRLAGEIDSADHRILLAEVVAGALLHADAEPMCHVRHNGMHY
jgi:flavin reductase (DIM6/NTAB) family NADH-FMN oxidoreductase RutF